MSHELRTPLNSIIGFCQLLETRDTEHLTTNQTESIGIIHDAGKHLLSIINDILDLSQIESGEIKLIPKDVDLNATITQCISACAPLLEENNITLTDHSPPNLYIFADPQRLKSILLNLLSNAIKYNKDQGHVNIYASKTETNQVIVTIEDSGMGIKQDFQKDIFTPFNRLGRENLTVQGAGIGLTICKESVERMGGKLHFKSVANEGSTFWFNLPAGNNKGAVSLEEEEISKNAETLKDTDIFYVEDNLSNILLMERVLKSELGIKIRTSHTAEEAIVEILKKPPCIILMDIDLPGENGIIALEKIRKLETLTDIPIIAVSADAIPENVSLALSKGFNDYITKPFEINHLVKTIIKFTKDH